MADCHKLFQQFNGKISIGDKKKKMKTSKNALRDRIREWFRENQPEYEPKFYIQGSHKMNTGIRTKEDICDLDDGVYFFRKPDVTGTTLQSWVKQAVDGYTDTPAGHRKKCVRSIFAGDYEIDNPVYYKDGDGPIMLAVKNADFENSDPKAMVDWFNGFKDKNGQMIRTVMALKAWGDNLNFKMPSGLAMTILACNARSIVPHNDRDDIFLKDILKRIKSNLDIWFQCIVPVEPNDNLFADYDQEKKDKILQAFADFINDGESALREENELKASKLWAKHLGDRFPLGEDQKQEQSDLSRAVAFGATGSKPWAR